MKKQKNKKLNVMSCKCEITDSSPGNISVHKNCKCKPVGRKERHYDSVMIDR